MESPRPTEQDDSAGDPDPPGVSGSPEASGVSDPQLAEDADVVPHNDFGAFVRSDWSAATIFDGLKHRWQPNKKEDFPESFHVRGGVRRRRALNANHLQRYPWLAVSRHGAHWSAWCSSCVLLGVSEEGGGHSGAGQRMGVLVTRPLRDFSDLTGKEGRLDVHERPKNAQHTVVGQLDSAKQKQIERN